MLKWVFGADTSQFKQGLADMRSQTNALTSGLKGQLASALGIGVIIASFKKLFDEMDRVQKLGLRFGESAESIQRVKLAADLAGANIEVVAKAMQTATRNALEAATGMQSYQEAFEALGVNANEFVNMPMEEKLIELAKALETSSGDGEKLAMIMQVMGGRATEIIPLLKQGSEELKKQFAETNVLAQDQVDAMAEANDRITKVMQNLNVFMGNAVGGIMLLWEGVKSFFIQIGNAISNSFDLAVNTASAAVKVISSALSFDLSGTKEALAEYNQVVKDGLKTTVDDATAEAKRASKVIGDLLTPKKQEKDKDLDQAIEDTLAAAEALKEEEKKRAKLVEDVAKMQRDADLRRMSDAEKLVSLEKEINGLRDLADGSDSTALEAQKEILEIEKEIETIREKQKTDQEKLDSDKKSLMEEIAKMEADAELRKLTTAEKILKLEEERLRLIEKAGTGEGTLEDRKKQLELEKELESLKETRASEEKEVADKVKDNQEKLDDLEKTGPTLVTSTLASVGGGGPAAMFGQEAIEKQKVTLLQEIAKLLAEGLPDSPQKPIEPSN